MALLSVGHSSSWAFRRVKSWTRSAIVGVGLLGAVALVPRTIGMAQDGDWLPLAHFLLLFQCITSFELRTRGGLYASIGISGAIFFFVSQQAFDLAFSVFLMGFTTLFLAFLAMSFLVDQAHQAEVRWFKSRFAFAWLWSAVFLLSLGVSAAAFVMLPKGLADPMRNARDSVLPIRASTPSEQAQVGSQATFDSRIPPGPVALPTGPGQMPATRVNAGAHHDTADSEPVQDGANHSVQAPFVPSGQPPRAVAGEDPEAPDERVVMHVRSPVLTYWRGQVFDTFDGVRWHRAPGAWALESRGPDAVVYRSREGRADAGAKLYVQTFFLKEPTPGHTLFSGYSPLIASVLPVSDGGGPLLEGAVYRLVSVLPDFTTAGLSQAAPRVVQEPRYHQIPYFLEDLREEAHRITSGARTDLDRMRRIIGYMDANKEFAADAPNQLSVTAPLEEFLAKRSSGTSMDFATASVLLARAAGVPARLVTGYLPGRFDPLSGTYVVKAGDRHAWAEAYLGGVGWVPFDSTPRPAAAAYLEGGSYRSAAVSKLFSTDFGEDVFESLRRSPQWLAGRIEHTFGQGLARTTAVATAAALLAAALYLVRKLSLTRGRPVQSAPYFRLEGDGRPEMLRVYMRAEKLLRGAGLATARGPSQTLCEYTALAEASLGSASHHLAWLRQAAGRAAYDPRPADVGLLVDARDRLYQLNVALKTSHRTPSSKSKHQRR